MCIVKWLYCKHEKCKMGVVHVGPADPLFLLQYKQTFYRNVKHVQNNNKTDDDDVDDDVDNVDVMMMMMMIRHHSKCSKISIHPWVLLC